jgi:hypothetical protein
MGQAERETQERSRFGRVQGVIINPSPHLTPPIRHELEAKLTGFFQFLLELGYRSNRDFIKIDVDPSVEGNAFYSALLGSIVLGPDTVVDPDTALHGYAMYVSQTEFGDTLGEIEIAFADYLVASFQDNPKIGERWVRSLKGTQLGARFRGADSLRDLNNTFKYNYGNEDHYERARVWGGSFWDLRRLLGVDRVNPNLHLADRLIYGARQRKPRDPVDMVRALLDLDRELEPPNNHATEIRRIFERRGLDIPVNIK